VCASVRPVEIYTHAGEAVNVSMAPGDMVMYESHTCVHGRPAPLKGRFFANVFVHFEPIDSAGHQKNGNRQYGTMTQIYF